MSDELPDATPEEQDRWIFLQASIWPDLSRGIPKYHREYWHFVNHPFFLSDLDEMALKKSREPNTSVVLPSPLADAAKLDLNCMQAFKLCVRELSDSHSTANEKAICYCWLLHIAGDSHQPLHSTSLRSRARFNQPEGDRGGHLPIVPIEKATNLHAYWDSLYGGRQPFKDIMDRTCKVLTPDVKIAAEAAREILRIELWIDESHKLAKTEDVYSKEFLAAVSAAEDSHKKPKPVELSADYQKRARQIADKRVAEAGYRLAEILKQID